MIKRIVKDKDGNILEDKEVFVEKGDVSDNSEDSKEKGKFRKTTKKS